MLKKSVSILIIIIAAAWTSSGYQASRSAPRFSLRTLDGRIVTTKQLDGGIFVLDFWATWCAPCVAEIPVFNELQRKYAGRGVKVFGVAVQSGWPRDIRRFAKKHKMEYQVLAGNDQVVSDFDVISFPTTYLIGPGLNIYKKYSGAYPEKWNDIERGIEQLLAAR
jgi:thiol-disulfide isomerase/thioredoxin